MKKAVDRKGPPRTPKKPPTKNPPKDLPATSSYEAYKDRQAGISRARSVKGREIGPLPEVVDTADREQIINADVLGLAGPDVTIAAVMLCTVIYPNDLSDRYLSAELHPEWQGIRTKMLEAFPERMDLWDEYAEMRRESFRSGDRGKRANEFLRARFVDMHRGAVVNWPERKEPDELSGVQSAMNKYYADRRGFLAEYQNTPEADTGPITGKELVPVELIKRLSGVERGKVPPDATRITTMIDCGAELHWYAVVAWTVDFGGRVTDYGAWPRQSRGCSPRRIRGRGCRTSSPASPRANGCTRG
jgi:hypothetical protein